MVCDCKQNGWAVRDFRIKAGLSRAELAERARTSYSHVANIENEHKDPDEATLQRIATVLTVDIRSVMRNPPPVASRNGKPRTGAA